MLPRGLGALLTTCLVALAVGCGDDESTVTVTESAPTTSAESTTTAESTGTTTEDGTTPPADKTVKKLTGFSSPTGNIGCYIDRSSVRCDISNRDWEPPKAPSECELDYGQGIELSAGAEPQFVCAGDTALGAGEPLAYGQSISSGLLRCESEETGMTCTDSETGRGFTLSEQAYEIF